MAPLFARHSVVAGERFPYARAWPRYPISAQSEATEPLSGQTLTGLVTVIGRGGCYFQTVDTLAAGTVVRVRIRWREATFEAWARVAHSVTGSGMGMAFFDVEPSPSELLGVWIEELARSAAWPSPAPPQTNT